MDTVVPLRAGALIFDFDGVLADTETLHYETFASVLAEEGISLGREANDREYVGIDVLSSFDKAFEDAGRRLHSTERARLVARKSERFSSGIGRIRLFPGIPELVEAAAARFPLAIASGALRTEILAVLRNHALERFFEILVTADDGLRSKPEPDSFLRALELLRMGPLPGLEARDVVVVEDSVPGILAARRAGMRCIALAHSHPAEMLSGADVVLPSAAHWDWRLLGLLE